MCLQHPSHSLRKLAWRSRCLQPVGTEGCPCLRLRLTGLLLDACSEFSVRRERLCIRGRHPLRSVYLPTHHSTREPVSMCREKLLSRQNKHLEFLGRLAFVGLLALIDSDAIGLD